jgi:hypothetical protein
MFKTSASAHQSVRKLVLQALSVPSQSVDPLEVNGIQAAMRESLLVAVDAALADIIATSWLSRARTPSVDAFGT